MPPTPCQHCGNNFMPAFPISDGLRLCNNCSIKNQIKNFRGKIVQDLIGITIQIPKQIQAKIEDDCITLGIDFSEYFLRLYENVEILKKEQSDLEKDIYYHTLGEPCNTEYPTIDQKKSIQQKKGKKYE